jgi:hypothetical protein
VISHWLALSTNLSAGFYLQFYTIYQCISYGSGKKQFLGEILVNPDIWMRVNCEEGLRIVNHLVDIVFPVSNQSFATVKPFTVVLYYLILHYFSECRHVFRSLIILATPTYFTASDFPELVAQCRKHPDNRVCGELLELMKLLVFNSVGFINGIDLTLGDILPLLKLIHPKDSDLTIPLFRTGLNFFNHSVLPDVSLPIWLHMFLFPMRDAGDSASFFRFLLEKGIELSPDAIAMGCWHVVHMNGSDQFLLFHFVQLHGFPRVKSS